MSYNPLDFWQDRAQSWANEAFQTEADWEEIKEFVKTELPTWEIGCGQGRWSFYFPFYRGTDISELMIEEAKKVNPEARFEVAQCPFDDNMDWLKDEVKQIFTYTALEHITPEDMDDVVFPKSVRLVFVEPHLPSGVQHCFQHDYEALFPGLKKVKEMDVLSVYVREP